MLLMVKAQNAALTRKDQRYLSDCFASDADRRSLRLRGVCLVNTIKHLASVVVIWVIPAC